MRPPCSTTYSVASPVRHATSTGLSNCPMVVSVTIGGPAGCTVAVVPAWVEAGDDSAGAAVAAPVGDVVAVGCVANVTSAPGGTTDVSSSSPPDGCGGRRQSSATGRHSRRPPVSPLSRPACGGAAVRSVSDGIDGHRDGPRELNRHQGTSTAARRPPSRRPVSLAGWPGIEALGRPRQAPGRVAAVKLVRGQKRRSRP